MRSFVTDLPSGTVTLLFTDIEGSTPLVYQLGDEYGAMLTAHRHVLRGAVKEAGGFEVDCRADEFFAVFQRAQDAATAAIAGQRDWRNAPGRKGRWCACGWVCIPVRPQPTRAHM